ncbi:hypothetical protein BZA05DRAFT_97213 [Tricharina praecox]|uniref:uncharacterized protein n=1 Tax=Tricharina praecox TaxID=43433 RepID=UPI00221F349B|nr:uncharacterized protein BZA05DRAFT_97213 [Tricharina praecox]KAI5848414.1 hypothetical protein BZA05DRAFT_97213 [Tricharina praecox]
MLGGRPGGGGGVDTIRIDLWHLLLFSRCFFFTFGLGALTYFDLLFVIFFPFYCIFILPPPLFTFGLEALTYFDLLFVLFSSSFITFTSSYPPFFSYSFTMFFYVWPGGLDVL